MPQNFKSWGISFLYSINIQANSSLLTTSLIVRYNHKLKCGELDLSHFLKNAISIFKYFNVVNAYLS